MKCYLNLVLVTSFLTKQENGNARHDASQKTIKNSTLLHSIGILANQAKATKRTTAACKMRIELILNCYILIKKKIGKDIFVLNRIYYLQLLGQEEGVSRKSTPVHVIKDRRYVKCPQLSTQGGMGSKLSKIWST